MNKDKMLDELSVLQERFANGMGWRDGEYAEALGEAIELINEMPTADVVEVVRCKDCKYAMPEGRENVYICKAMTNPNYCWADDYCSCGERKDDE